MEGWKSRVKTFQSDERSEGVRGEKFKSDSSYGRGEEEEKKSGIQKSALFG